MIKYFVRTTGEREFNYDLDYELLVDKEKKPVESFINQLKHISQYDSVLLEDDLILCKDFKFKMEEVIKQYSNYIINFFTAPDEYFTTRMNNTFYYNQCTYYPKGIASKLAAEMEKVYKRMPRAQYDVIEHNALTHLGIPNIQYRPCLVQHIDKSSLIQDDNYPRRTPYFIDYLEELGIDYKDANEIQNRRKLYKLLREKFKT